MLSELVWKLSGQSERKFFTGWVFISWNNCPFNFIADFYPIIRSATVIENILLNLRNKLLSFLSGSSLFYEDFNPITWSTLLRFVAFRKEVSITQCTAISGIILCCLLLSFFPRESLELNENICFQRKINKLLDSLDIGVSELLTIVNSY